MSKLQAAEKTFEFFFNRLVKGYKSVMGREPEGLDLIKIRQEAKTKQIDANKVIEVQFGKPFGEEVDALIKSGDVNIGTADKTPAYTPSKSQTDFEIQTRLESDNAKAIEAFKKRNPKDDMATGGRAGYYGGGQAMVGEDLSEIGHGSDSLMARNMQLAPNSMATTSTGLNYLLGQDNDTARVPYANGNGVADEDAEKAALGKRVRELMDEGFDMGEAVRKAMSEGYAKGGRIGYNKGKAVKEVADKGRRGFMKAAGATTAGIAALKTGLLGFGEKVAPVAKEAVEAVSNTAGQVPAYFLNLVKKIKNLGDDASNLATQDRQKVTKFKDYEMTEDISTGNIEILKKERGGFREDVYMSYKVDDVPIKGKKGSTKVEEYEEYTARPDQDGKMRDVEPGVPDEVVQEGSVFEDTLSEFGKADGGRIGYGKGDIVTKGIPALIKAGEGKFTKAQYLIERIKNTIKGSPDDKYVQETFPNFIKELEANPDLAKNENVFKELGGDLPEGQQIVVYGDDTLDFFTTSSGPQNIKKLEEFMAKHNLPKDQALEIMKMEPNDQVMELTKTKFMKQKRTDNADGGRIGFNKGKAVLKGLDYLKELFRKKDYLEEFPRVDIKKLMQGDEPIKLYSGVGDRQANTLKAYKETAKDFNTTVDKVKKDNFKGQWFTPFKEYASGFGNARNIKSKMLSTELTPKEIRMAKRYVNKVNKKDKMISRMKMEGMDNPPKYRITTDDNTVIIPRIKLKKLKEAGKIDTDYMVLDKIKSKLGLAEGGVAGILGE